MMAWVLLGILTAATLASAARGAARRRRRRDPQVWVLIQRDCELVEITDA